MRNNFLSYGTIMFIVGLIIRLFIRDEGLILIIVILLNAQMIYAYDYALGQRELLLNWRYHFVIFLCIVLCVATKTNPFAIVYLIFPLQAFLAYKLASKNVSKGYATFYLSLAPLLINLALSSMFIIFAMGMSRI